MSDATDRPKTAEELGRLSGFGINAAQTALAVEHSRRLICDARDTAAHAWKLHLGSEVEISFSMSAASSGVPFGWYRVYRHADPGVYDLLDEMTGKVYPRISAHNFDRIAPDWGWAFERQRQTWNLLTPILAGIAAAGFDTVSWDKLTDWVMDRGYIDWVIWRGPTWKWVSSGDKSFMVDIPPETMRFDELGVPVELFVKQLRTAIAMPYATAPLARSGDTVQHNCAREPEDSAAVYQVKDGLRNVVDYPVLFIADDPLPTVGNVEGAPLPKGKQGKRKRSRRK